MSSTKHTTPGPWQYSIATDGTCSIWADHSKYVIGRAKDESHARLIAAAPDLAEALLAMRKRFDFEMPRGYKDFVDAALAKAGVQS